MSHSAGRWPMRKVEHVAHATPARVGVGRLLLLRRGLEEIGVGHDGHEATADCSSSRVRNIQRRGRGLGRARPILLLVA